MHVEGFHSDLKSFLRYLSKTYGEDGEVLLRDRDLQQFNPSTVLNSLPPEYLEAPWSLVGGAAPSWLMENGIPESASHGASDFLMVGLKSSHEKPLFWGFKRKMESIEDHFLFSIVFSEDREGWASGASGSKVLHYYRSGTKITPPPDGYSNENLASAMVSLCRKAWTSKDQVFVNVSYGGDLCKSCQKKLTVNVK